MVTEQHFDAVVFDAYGTLLDVHAAMARHAKRLGSNWQAGDTMAQQAAGIFVDR